MPVSSAPYKQITNTVSAAADVLKVYYSELEPLEDTENPSEAEKTRIAQLRDHMDCVGQLLVEALNPEACYAAVN